MLRDAQKQFRLAPAAQLDSFVLGLLAAFVSYEKPAPETEQRRAVYRYEVQGKCVCKNAFMKYYGVGNTRLLRLQKLNQAGMCFPKAHGNVGEGSLEPIVSEQSTAAREFIANCSSIHGLPMPVAPRGRGQMAPTYLPVSHTYVSVHGGTAKCMVTMRCVFAHLNVYGESICLR